MHSTRVVSVRLGAGEQAVDEAAWAEIEESLVRNFFVAAGQTSRRAREKYGLELVVDFETVELERA